MKPAFLLMAILLVFSQTLPVCARIAYVDLNKINHNPGPLDRDRQAALYIKRHGDPFKKLTEPKDPGARTFESSAAGVATGIMLLIFAVVGIWWLRFKIHQGYHLLAVGLIRSGMWAKKAANRHVAGLVDEARQQNR